MHPFSVAEEKADGTKEVHKGRAGKAKKKGNEARQNEQSRNAIKMISEQCSPALSKAETLDKMLLVLFDALFLTQSEQWTKKKVANLLADETYELARWWSSGARGDGRQMPYQFHILRSNVIGKRAARARRKSLRHV